MRSKHKWGSSPDLSGPWHFHRERLMIKYLTSVLDHGHILDCGFGSGTLMIELARRGFRITGIDMSSEFAYYVQSKIKSQEISKQISIIQSDLTHLSFFDECFDGVVCGEVLEHTKEDKSAILELYRVMKKDGFCVITVPATESLWSCVDEWAGHYRRYSKESLIKILKEVGFIIKKIQYYGFPMGLLYHKFIFLPIFRRRLRKEAKKGYPTQRKFNSFYLNITKLFSYIFYLDHFLSRCSKGTGLITICQKQKS